MSLHTICAAALGCTACLKAIAVPMLTFFTLPGASLLIRRHRISPFFRMTWNGVVSSASCAQYCASSGSSVVGAGWHECSLQISLGPHCRKRHGAGRGLVGTGAQDISDPGP